MELTGKCEVYFEEWYRIQTRMKPRVPWLNFKELPESMQFGVYEDFFDTHKIFISTNKEYYEDEGKVVIDNYHAWVNEELIIDQTTRSEARIKAIEKANEIYNKKYD